MKKLLAILSLGLFLVWGVLSIVQAVGPCPPANPCAEGKIFMNANVRDDGTCHVVCKDIKECAQAQKICKDGNPPTDCKDNDKGRCVCKCAK